MIVITDVRPHKRTKLFEVYSEAGMEFLANEKFLIQNEIRRYAEFDEEDFQIMKARAQILDGIRKSVDILSIKDYSRQELHRKLCDKGVPEDAAWAAVGYMTENGYQDDLRYAKRLAELASRNYGRRRAEQILCHHGIDRETAKEALDAIYSEELDEDTKLDRIVEKAAAGKDLKDPAQRNKIYAKLARLGYDSSAISAAITRLEAKREDDTV